MKNVTHEDRPSILALQPLNEATLPWGRNPTVQGHTAMVNGKVNMLPVEIPS